MKKEKEKEMVEIECDNPGCKKKFNRYIGEYRRSLRMGRKQYCNRSCYGKGAGYKAFDVVPEQKRKELQRNIKKYCGNLRDEYTSFRFFMKVIGGLGRKSKWGDVDIAYLKEIWEKQNGICPFTGWELILPNTVDGWDESSSRVKRASLDRIDSEKGYLKGNVRFVSVMANYAKNKLNDYELINFCKAVAEYHK